jgi:hypothetical protein
MKNLGFLLIGILLSVAATSQRIDTSRTISEVNGYGFQYKIHKIDSAAIFPTDTFKLKHDWRAISFKNGSPYYWNGTYWQAFGSGGGSGLGNLNGLTGSTQNFATGTSGSNFNISSSGISHVFNIPDASASARGALSISDWSTFNGKVNTASNLAGTGVGVWKDKNTVDLRFKKFVSGQNTTWIDMGDSLKVNATGDTNWVYLRSFGSHGTDDSVILKAAIATGKNVRIDPGFWFTNAQLHPKKFQIIEGYGNTSVLATSKDTGHVFYCIDSSIIRDLSFQGPGIGSDPEGGPVFTGGNAIYLGGNGNRVLNVTGFDLKGALVTSWEFTTIYNNKIFNSSAVRCTVGFYILTNSEYGSYMFNEAYNCKVGAIDRCGGNNKWDMYTGEFNVVGFRLYGTGGCNGDHGAMSNSTLNHNTGIGLEILGANNGYLFTGMQIILNNITLGTNDTARGVTFINTALSTSTITATKIAHVRFNGGYLLPGATLTVNGTMASSLEIAALMNSPYERIVAGSVMGSFTKGYEVSDSLREFGLGKSNDTTKYKIRTVNPITGADAYSNWPTGGGGGGMTNPMTTTNDVIYSSDNSGTPARLAAGANGTFLGISGGAIGYYTPAGSGGITTGTTTVASGTNTRILYNNSGVVGEYSVTGSGTTVPLSTSPTFTTDITTAKILGGSAAGSKVTIQSTSGTGTTTGTGFEVLGGTAGATTVGGALNNGSWGFGVAPANGFMWTKLPNTSGGWLDHDNFGNPVRFTTPAGLTTWKAINSTTNSTVFIKQLAFQSTGTAANGLGLGIQFLIHNASATQRNTSNIESVYTDVVNATEDADLIIKNIRAGTLTEAARFTSVGGFSINGSIGSSGQALLSGGTGAAATWGSVMTNPLTTTGDIVYSSSGTTPARLAIGATSRQALQVVSGIPAWGYVVDRGVPVGGSTTSDANIDAITVSGFMYTRTDDIINFSFELTIDPTANSTLTTAHVGLPIASNFTQTYHANGNITCGTIAGFSGSVTADVSTDELRLDFISATTSSVVMKVTGQYRIL